MIHCKHANLDCAMKVSDFIYQFPTGSLSRRDGICRVRIFVSAEGAVWALVTELERNSGDSITNSIERIRKSLIRQGLISDRAAIIEHYEREEPNAHTFDLVSFDARTSGRAMIVRRARSAISMKGSPHPTSASSRGIRG